MRITLRLLVAALCLQCSLPLRPQWAQRSASRRRISQAPAAMARLFIWLTQGQDGCA